VFSTTLLDLNWTGRPRSIAAALLQYDSIKAIVDPGPSSTLATLRQRLSLHGVSVAQLDYVFLTHIHLDHAGATGCLVEENPNLKVYVHSRGAGHMADPDILLHSAGRLYGEQMKSLFGECLPVPESNLHVLHGGEMLPLGDTSLQVLCTPGHASHHVTYFEPSEGTAFVGDTAGICVNGHPLVLPATPPPDIDLDLWSESLNAIEKLQPRKLFLTHFGFSNQPSRHIANFRTRLQLWSEVSARVLAAGLEDTDALQEFSRLVSAEAEPFVAPEEARHYRYNGQLPLSWMGLARYHRKRTAVQTQ
jgi:glyoxylase-like metal-dependent hydrolase (beta-lactamase superfamily II)